jgi:hypothetical protein
MSYGIRHHIDITTGQGLLGFRGWWWGGLCGVRDRFPSKHETNNGGKRQRIHYYLQAFFKQTESEGLVIHEMQT